MSEFLYKIQFIGAFNPRILSTGTLLIDINFLMIVSSMLSSSFLRSLDDQT